jgi:hypothetical protein
MFRPSKGRVRVVRSKYDGMISAECTASAARRSAKNASLDDRQADVSFQAAVHSDRQNVIKDSTR